MIAATLSPLATPATAEDADDPITDPIPRARSGPRLGPRARGVRPAAGLDRPTGRSPTSGSAAATTGSTTSARCPTAPAGCTCPTSTARSTSSRTASRTVYLDVKARVPGLPLLARPGLGLRVRRPSTPSSRRTASSTPSHTETARRSRRARPTPAAARTRRRVQSVVTEWTADDPSADTFTGTSRELMRLRLRRARSTRIQQIDFNPDGRARRRGLRPALPRRRRRRVRRRAATSRRTWPTPSGKILRIDPAGTDGAQRRVRHPRRPTRSSGEAGALGEIYALGMRDPHRFSWDAGGQHRMFLGHIGQHAIEAVYDVDAGDNFGWPRHRGPASPTATRTSAASTR